jgi:hypothetical protein
MTSAVRRGHGAGQGQPHVEVPLKDRRPANPHRTAANLAERKRRGKPFEKGNTAGAGRRPMLSLLAVDAADVPEASRRDLRRAERYRQRRVREETVKYGYADAGTCAVLGSSALVLASQRQVALLAFKTGDPALHKLAADLAEKHSQLELKASFMAKDSAAAKPDPAQEAMRVAQAAFQARLLSGQRHEASPPENAPGRQLDGEEGTS